MSVPDIFGQDCRWLECLNGYQKVADSIVILIFAAIVGVVGYLCSKAKLFIHPNRSLETGFRAVINCNNPSIKYLQRITKWTVAF